MMGRVVDTSVAIKWFLPEVHSTEAARLLNGSFNLSAPDLLFPEMGNVLWKRVRRGDMTEGEAAAVAAGWQTLPLRIHPSQPLLPLALEIACRTERTVYDSLYMALAIREDTSMVTADERLFNAIRSGPLAKHIVWVADLPK